MTVAGEGELVAEAVDGEGESGGEGEEEEVASQGLVAKAVDGEGKAQAGVVGAAAAKGKPPREGPARPKSARRSKGAWNVANPCAVPSGKKPFF